MYMTGYTVLIFLVRVSNARLEKKLVHEFLQNLDKWKAYTIYKNIGRWLFSGTTPSGQVVIMQLLSS